MYRDLEGEIANELADMAERRRRLDMGEVRYWEAPEPCRQRPVSPAVTAAIVHRVVAKAVEEAEARAENGLRTLATQVENGLLALAEEAGDMAGQHANRIAALEKAVAWLSRSESS